MKEYMEQMKQWRKLSIPDKDVERLAENLLVIEKLRENVAKENLAEADIALINIPRGGKEK